MRRSSSDVHRVTELVILHSQATPSQDQDHDRSSAKSAGAITPSVDANRREDYLKMICVSRELQVPSIILAMTRTICLYIDASSSLVKLVPLQANALSPCVCWVLGNYTM